MLSYKDLPDTPTESAVNLQRNEGLFGFMSKPLIDDLESYLHGKNALEVFSGRGFLSALLAERGVSIKATSLQQGHDQTYELGFACSVEALDVTSAILKYRDWMDVLIVCWPTAVPALYHSLDVLPDDVPIVFIGEVTDYSKPFHFLGGCATDEFFESVCEVQGVNIRYPTYRQDKVKVYLKKTNPIRCD
jgi:hypothetical protein